MHISQDLNRTQTSYSLNMEVSGPSQRNMLNEGSDCPTRIPLLRQLVARLDDHNVGVNHLAGDRRVGEGRFSAHLAVAGRDRPMTKQEPGVSSITGCAAWCQRLPANSGSELWRSTLAGVSSVAL